MAISMQGAWTVSVRSKSAAFPQRFIISGAASGNGVYNGATSTPAVNVTGASWSIRIEHNPGTGFIDSTEQITFPHVVGTNVEFDIQSDDSGGDKDFNDLVLKCSTPKTATDFIVYGHVSSYSGRCIINPCFYPYLVIDNVANLTAALKYDPIKKVIEKLYRERVIIKRIPLPDPPPEAFTPMMVPLAGQALIPAKQAQVLKVTRTEREETTTAVRSLNLASAAAVPVTAINSLELSGIYDQLVGKCTTTALGGYGLKFLEYDRTASELAGGPYTGTGLRETLGITSTDHNGNYIFRFTRSIGDFINESNIDTPLGGDEVVQSMPDVIAQLLDTTVPGGVAFESACYFNIGNLKRINICVPAGSIRPPFACQGGRALQRIGNIRLTTALTTFDGDGRVTCTDTSTTDIPQARCAAWHGSLRFFGCFLTPDGKKGPVQWYTIQVRHKVGSGWSSWQFYQEDLRLKQVGVTLPVSVGPFDRNLDVPDVGVTVAKAYENIELNGAWEASDWFVKAVLTTALYTSSPNTIQVRIQGYNGALGAGSREVGKTDTVTLFVDNTAPDFGIADVKMGAQNGGDCALFHLSGEPNPAPLTVEWKAKDAPGQLQSYAMTVRKGNIGNKPIVASSGFTPIADTYSAPVGTCASMTGTPGLVVTNIVPTVGNWLDANQPFCTFAVQVSASKRQTNGTDGPVINYGTAEYFLGIEQ